MRSVPQFQKPQPWNLDPGLVDNKWADLWSGPGLRTCFWDGSPTDPCLGVLRSEQNYFYSQAGHASDTTIIAGPGYYHSDDANEYASPTELNFSGADEWTTILLVRPTNFTGNYPRYTQASHSSYVNNRGIGASWGGSGNTLGANVFAELTISGSYYTSGSMSRDYVDPTYTDFEGATAGSWRWYVGRWRSGENLEIFEYGMDGEQRETSSNGPYSGTIDSATDFRYHIGQGGYGDDCYGEYHLLIEVPKYLDDGFIQELIADPFGPWTPVTNTNEAGIAAGGTNYTLTAEGGSVVLTGYSASLLYDRTITMGSSSVTLTGVDVSLLHDLVLTMGAGAITLTGSPVTFTLTVPAEPGEIVLTGYDVNLLIDKRLPAEAGTVTLTGSDVGILLDRIISAGAGTVTLTGQDVNLVLNAGITLQAEGGSIALTGQDVTLTKDWTISLSPGAVGLTGFDVGVYRNRLLSAEAESITVTGGDVSLSLARVLQAATGNVALTGSDVSLLRARRLLANAGAYYLLGQQVGLRQARILTAVGESIALTGSDAAITRGRVLQALGDTITLTGFDVSLFKTGLSYILSAEGGDITLTGNSVGLLWKRRLPVEPGTVSIIGMDAALTLVRMTILGTYGGTITASRPGGNLTTRLIL